MNLTGHRKLLAFALGLAALVALAVMHIADPVVVGGIVTITLAHMGLQTKLDHTEIVNAPGPTQP
jgi:hypothetical protein